MSHWWPSGYVSFSHLTNIIARYGQEWEIIRLPGFPLRSLNPAEHSGPSQIKHSLLQAISQLLSDGRLEAAAIVNSTGELVKVPAEAWRRLPSHVRVMGEIPDTVFEAALSGGSIVLTAGDQPREHGRPIIALQSVAMALRAGKPPPPPEMMPSRFAREPTPVPPPQPSDDSVSINAWVRGYAEGFIANGRKVKRDEAISAATQKLKCTTRQAETAFEALSYPDLRNPPRTTAK